MTTVKVFVKHPMLYNGIFRCHGNICYVTFIDVCFCNVHIIGTINGGGVTQGCPYPRFFTPQYPRFFTPNIPSPIIFTPQYPISQMSQSIDHIPDFARLECVCIHSFDIQLVRMDPVLLDIFIIAVNIHVHEHLELHFNNVHHSNMYMGQHNLFIHHLFQICPPHNIKLL